MHLAQLPNTITVPAMAVLFLSAPGAQAMPTVVTSAIANIKSSVEARGGFNGMGPVSLYLAVKDYLKDSNAYDPSVPNKCNLYVQTISGGNCKAQINCKMSDKGYEDLPAFTACNLNGRSYFSRPEIGDFSITFTKAGGKDGNTEDGLHHPVFQFANLNNWEPMDVQAILDNQSKDQHGQLCRYGGSVPGSQTIKWECAIPQIGTSAFGLSIFDPVDPTPGYTPGWCTMHVVQHQRNEYGIGADYAFDVVIHDGSGKIIGKTQLTPIDPQTKKLSVSSHLPFMVDITAKGGDEDPVEFSYLDQTWQNNNGHQSTFGNGPANGFEYGDREGDMGFYCA